jgi:UDP-3-O-[3-hydroxymyristoyl] N-acetylglucosamine deacetylase
MQRRTLARAIRHDGVGVHSGERCAAEVHPAAFGTGLRVGPRGADAIPVHVDAVVDDRGSTTLGTASWRVGMVEHLLAALVLRGITDAVITVDGPEVPILDGSALPWFDAVVPVDGPGLRRLVVKRLVEVSHAGGVATFEPGPPMISVDVDHGPSLRGSALTLLGGDGDRGVAGARTFAMRRDVDRLVAMGRGKGADPGNTVIYDDAGPSVPLRRPDEGVAHKLVDAVGDLALAGRPVRGRLHVVRGSHALHHAAVRALLDSLAAR